MHLTKEQILAATSRQYAEVDVPELGGTVTLQALTGAEMDDFRASCIVEKKDGTTERNLKNYSARFLIRAIVDAQTKERMFGSENITMLGKLPHAALTRLYDAAQKLNGLRDEDQEELVKNS